MIDNKTTNKQYPLPHPDNIASQDVGRIADAITMIDSDIAGCNTDVEECAEQIEALQNTALRIPSSQVGIIDPEIANVTAGRYLVVNSEGTGFTTVEGGGGEGGLKGEILVKRSDENFDTSWLDPRAITKQAMTVEETTGDTQLQSNKGVILSDSLSSDLSDPFPRHGLTQRQITSDETGDVNFSYIVADTKDAGIDDTSDLASKTNFGRVKIGDGINVYNGVISVDEIGFASKEKAGIVKIGDGINVTDGVISTTEYQQATHDTFGTVKLGDDFKLNASTGALELVAPNESIIYQTSNIKECFNNCITIDPNYAIYRLFVSSDCVINFDWSALQDPVKDIAFTVELYATDSHVISFNADIDWTTPCVGVDNGKTVIEFRRLLGTTQLIGDLKTVATSVVLNLTPASTDDVMPNFTVEQSGGGWSAYEFIQGRSNNNWNSLASEGDEYIWQINFVRSTCVTRLHYVHGLYASAPAFFHIEGSWDGVAWVSLLSLYNEKPAVDLNIPQPGFFRHYRLRASKDFDICYFQFYGFSVDDRLYELTPVTPYMTQNSQGGYIISSHTGPNNGSLYNLTQVPPGNYANFNAKAEGGVYWVQYELPEAEIANVFDIGVPNDAPDRFPTWFKIEGSNDQTNWTLLLERRGQTKWSVRADRQYHITNSIAYKYYRFTAISIPATEFRIARFRLYRRDDGVDQIQNIVPQLFSANQDGYTVTASSQYDNNHTAWHAFDRNSTTLWAANGSFPAWLRIELPNATAIDSMKITVRNDDTLNEGPSNFSIQGSNDGVDWDTLAAYNAITWIKGESKVFNFDNNTPYVTYRLYITASNSGNTSLASWEIGNGYRQYKKDLENIDYVVPVLTSNQFTDDSGTYTITTSSEHSDYKAFYLFDRSATTQFELQSGSLSGWVQIELPEAKAINYCAIGARDDSWCSATPRDYKLEGSNNATDWDTLLNIENSASFSNSELRAHHLDNSTAYKYYKLTIDNPNNTVLSFARWDLCDYSKVQEY